MSILLIDIIASIVRWAFSGSESLISSSRIVGITCHETPYLSLSHPQGPS